MQGYLSQVKCLQLKFDCFDLLHVPRSGNAHVDSLAMLATSSAQDLPRVILVEDLYKPARTRETVQINQIRVGPNWMDSIVRFLREDILPEEKIEADKIQRKATSYWLSEDHKLYKRSFSGPYLLCVHPELTESLLKELHEGICGSHTGGKSLAHRAITQGYWWPNIQREALEYVRKCDQCQRFASSIHQPGGILNPLSSPWPFAQWGLDIGDHFPKQWETRNISWSAQTILRSGLKRSLYPTSEKWMRKDLFGRTSLLDLEFLTCLSRTMAFNSIARCSENTVVSWGLLIGILLLLIPKVTDKQKL